MVVEELIEASKYGPTYADPHGGIAMLGSSAYRHRFGGSDWVAIDPSPLAEGPTLLLTFDLSDPLFKGIGITRIRELPLCSYVTCDLGHSAQLYRIDPREKRVVLLERGVAATEVHFPEFAPPLPEKPLSIQPMADADFPTTEDAYWRACDLFLGGGRFIRVLGQPLWLYAVAEVGCECGRTMKYVSSMGYETIPPFSQLIQDQPVFFGEMALYWLMCLDCLTVAVITQPT